ncbi:MAG: hypothetical protein IPK69_06770 [Phycisphaerales bacterium]|nr:MAG: hypothetical protein IPK69_06770 [Phycisphaerales bacterium]
MKMSPPIPVDQQLAALASGSAATYTLLQEYYDDLGFLLDTRGYITVTREMLANYLRQHLDVIEQHITNSTDPKYHDVRYFERVDSKYRVFTWLHGQPKYVNEYDDIVSAAVDYLFFPFRGGDFPPVS